MPEIGQSGLTRAEAASDCPSATLLSRFRKYLVFYRPITEGIEVTRVLHGARDIDSILGDDFAIAIEDDADSDDEANNPE
jgi:plasmid stabilization system protein ParE